MTNCAEEMKQEPAAQSFSNALRSKGLAILLTLSTPTAIFSLTGCSPEKDGGATPTKPEYSSLVVSNTSSGMPLTSVAARLVSLGELHGPVQDALVATISFGETSGLGDPAIVNGEAATVVALKKTLQDAHRALSNAGNDPSFGPIQGQIQTVSSSVAELMTSVSSQSNIDTYWNKSALGDDGQMRGVPIALKAQEAMEKMVGALDEDMASLVPGFQLSRVVHFAETLGGAKSVVEDIGNSLKGAEQDPQPMTTLKKRLADSITAVESASKEPEVTKLATGTTEVVSTMTALYTGLAQDITHDKLTALQEKALTALEKLQVAEKEVKKELEQRQYHGSTFMYWPHMHHWYHTGAMSPYSSWGGASGFSSTSRFSTAGFHAHGDAAHPVGGTTAKPSAVTKGGAGFKAGTLSRPSTSSGFKPAGFGSSGSSFGGRGIS